MIISIEHIVIQLEVSKNKYNKSKIEKIDYFKEEQMHWFVFEILLLS